MGRLGGVLSFLFIIICLNPLSSLQAEPQPGDLVTSLPKDKKQIALTFDDGPGPYTEKFLDLLDEYEAKATFFMLGQQVLRYPEIARAVRDRGHKIANHTWNHVNYKKRLRDVEKISDKALPQVKGELRWDFKRTSGMIKKITQVQPTLARMPHGIDRPWIKEIAKEKGLILVNWTYGADWQNRSVDELTKSYLKAIRPGAILLFHDGGGNRAKSLAITKAVLESAQKSGYTFVLLQ